MEAHLSHFNVMIDGAQAPRTVMDDLLECLVENSVHLPDMCTLRIHDSKFEWIDSDTFKIGAAIEIHASEEGASPTPIFYGEITAQEMDLSGAEGVPTIIIRAFDRSHRLHRGRISKTWSKAKDSEIVSEIGRQAGLNVVAKTTPHLHDWIIQNNQTNWEFLSERAARNGYRIFLKKEKELVFQPVEDGAEDTVELAFGDETLRSFRPRMTAAHQVNQVIVRGWCPKEKRTIVGRSSQPRGIVKTGDGMSGGDVAKKAFGAADLIIVDRPVHTDQEAEAMAQSILDEVSGDFIEAEGVSLGNPNIMPGKMLKITGIGNRFSTQYYVTSVVHAYTPAEGYTSMFSVSGKSPATLLALLTGGEMAKRSNMGGNLVVGIVTDNKDDQGLGRVKVKYPWLTEDHTSFWARIVSQMAGSGRGMFNLPEIGDEVLVAFEHGEMSRPYVLGQLWNGKDKPPVLDGKPEVAGGLIMRRGFYTRIGHRLHFDDTDEKGNITVQTSNGHIILMDDKEENVIIQTKGKHIFKLDDKNKKIECATTGNHQITMDDQGKKITVKDSGGNAIQLDATAGLIAAKANKEINLSAPQINIKADVKFSLQALKAEINADTTLDLKANAMVNVQGSAIVDIKGGLVKINS